MFEGSRLKIKRAKKHISDLQYYVDSFIKKQPYRIVTEQDPETSNLRWVIRVRKQLPNDIPAIIGDAIHNLRSALDLLACDLVRINGGSIEEVYFPFCKDGNKTLALRSLVSCQSMTCRPSSPILRHRRG